jgi:hypothetical protein
MRKQKHPVRAALATGALAALAAASCATAASVATAATRPAPRPDPWPLQRVWVVPATARQPLCTTPRRLHGARGIAVGDGDGGRLLFEVTCTLEAPGVWVWDARPWPAR